MLLSKTIRLFLGSIGRKDEYEYYLNKFYHHEGPYFALICPDEATIEQMDDLLVFDLQTLLKLDLKTALLICGPTAKQMRQCLRQWEGLFAFEEDEPDRIRVQYLPDLSLEEALLHLVPSESQRVHLLRVGGGFHYADGKPVQYHYLNKRSDHPLDQGDKELLHLVEPLMERVPAAHVSVTSPLGLMEELFTVKGAGTLFRKGSEIDHYCSVDQVDMPRLFELFENGFGKALKKEHDFGQVRQIYVERDYRGAALLECHAAGLYLSKFVVSQQARGEGLAQELWELACEKQEAIFWRSRHDNPINRWYEKYADGLQHGPDWNIFWKGVEPKHISDIIAYCRSRPADFEEN